MEKCPPEILHRMFALACTDDGRTGRALSLVSTRILDICASHRYFSIHVSGTAAIIKFANFVQAYQPPIQYLVLDCALVANSGTVTENHCPPDLSKNRTRRRPSRSEYDRICAEADTILHNLAPKLEGLYLIPAGIPLKLDRFTFPLLDTFYLYDYPSDILIPWTPSHFPSLVRLDVSCDMVLQTGHGAAFSVFGGLPSLTHLGCCMRTYEGIIISYFFASLWEANASHYIPQGSGWLGKLAALQMFRVGVLRPSEKLTTLTTRGRSGESKLLKEILEKIPVFVFEKRDALVGGALPMEEWCYIVKGGQGFRRNEEDEFIPACP